MEQFAGLPFASPGALVPGGHGTRGELPAAGQKVRPGRVATELGITSTAADGVPK